MSNFSAAALEPVAQRWNVTAIDFTEITMDRNFALLLVSLVSAVLWVVYVTYYNSRVVGYVLTRLINKFYFQDENFQIGSFTLNALSGKIMFRDIVYINYDYTLRIQDGYLIFRWWRSYIPKDVSEDLSHSDTRLSIMLNGFELHFYNRCSLYADLERAFGLEPRVQQRGDGDGGAGGAGDPDRAMNLANDKRRRAAGAVRSEAAMARTWRDLIPVIKVDVCAGRVVFGNRLVPTTLSVSVEEAHVVYSTKPPASSLDHLMHFVKAKAENCKVMLAPSPSYTAMADEPPRYMGEGFVVMSSNYMEVYFYMDEPGLVPARPVLLQLANGDVVESAPPIWGVDIKCGKGTDFSYGPWADRQRDHLFRFFFPPNYESLVVTPQPQPGDRRQMQSFDIRLSTLNEATVDILFTKNKETNAVHINIGAGSYLEVTLPWIVLQDGYTTKVTGQLLHLEATTSLQYRSLAESETLEYTVRCHYPRVWNHHQCWRLALTGCKATAHFVYTHIDFFQDLLTDWASKARPDVLHFVPYTWKISILLKECEVITVSNQHNWIDCSSTNQENKHVAFCGDLLDVSFDLPFVDFLPDVIPLKIWVQGEAVDMSLYLPEVNTSRLLLLSIDKNMKLVPNRLKASKWRRKCVRSAGWVECWSVPIVALSVRYVYHPVPPLGPEPQADITTPEKEELLLSPMRIPRPRRPAPRSWPGPAALPPDRVSVELEVGPSMLLAYGTIITSFMNLLENIFGEDQTFTDMQKSPNMDGFFWSGERGPGKQHAEAPTDEAAEGRGAAFDPRRYRPLEVTVSIILHDIQAHLVKNCSETEPPCPVVLIERFGFEMDKRYAETRLQLLLSPSILVSGSSQARSGPHTAAALQQGHLMLSSLQLRGHGVFSDAGRALDDGTAEYAWMMELQLGQLTGRITMPQLYQIVSSLEIFLLLVCDDENELAAPEPARQCHHGVTAALCVESDAAARYRCPTPDEIKYRMLRVAVDLVDVYVADTSTALQAWLSPARLSFCNLHGAGFAAGLTALLPAVRLGLYTQTNLQPPHHGSSASSVSQLKLPESENWLSVGSVALGPVLVETADSLPQSPKNLHQVQQRFLRLHDEKTRRLWFLWPGEGRAGQCGCTGGCAFFGSNRNGPNFFKPTPSDLQEGINVAMFNVMEVPGEFGYGQSLLHRGQLVFHTPPYNTLNVCLQPAKSLIPSPLPPPPSRSPHGADRRPLTRRFSYTHTNKGSGGALAAGARSDVPYARLVDSSQPLGAAKIDSDSKLNKSVLSVPQMESSVSDSKLALSCALKEQRPKRLDADAFAAPKTAARPVGASESHYSLNAQAPREDAPPEPQRTVSITSENQSEAFFSADEDMFPSRSSSLKHSFGSRHSAARDKSSFGVTDLSHDKWTGSITRSEPADTAAPDTASTLSARPDSESGSVSSTSFISAISSQEDMTLVNLHQQTDKPIVDSPILMASYMQHLPQYRCSNWGACSLPSGADVFTLPLFKRAEDGTLVYVGQKYLPSFEPVRPNGIRLAAKKEPGQPYSAAPTHFNSQIKAHPYPQIWWETSPADEQEPAERGAAAGGDAATGVAVRLRGEVLVTLSPLVLESAQQFVDSLTPVLANIHPITVINHLRLLCISSVQQSNVLKQKPHVMSWLPQMTARDRGAPGRDAKCQLATVQQSDVHEEELCAQLQATLSVPKVSVVLIQSAVVEDMISFSALDNIQDLTCVSLFGITLENITAKYVSTRRTLESVQLFYRPQLRALGSKKSFGIMKGPRALVSAPAARGRPERGEPVYIETSQQQCEDINFTLNVGKVHGQLRRVRSESSSLKDAVITGIPGPSSKVSFRFTKDAAPDTSSASNSLDAHKELGYIMFECGVDAVSVRVSRHAASQARAEPAEPAAPAEPAEPAEPAGGRDSARSDDPRPSKRASALEELFRKKDQGSKPGTPNLGAAPPPQMPEPSTPGPEDSHASSSTLAPARDAANTTSAAVDLKLLWFNFAAPPRTPITRKIDYTRLDWNLVSTAAPALQAWLSPSARLAARARRLWRARARRLAATAASLMASALDVPSIHHCPKSRYSVATPMSTQLLSEPALQLCGVLLRHALQLCGVLLRHALQADAAALQADLAARHLPALSTLRQGVIVLSRQWKNILYTPLLLEHNYKSKMMKPLNVTFALPDLLEDSAEGWPLDAEMLDENCHLLDVDIERLNPPVEGLSAGGSPRTSPPPPPLPAPPPPPPPPAARGGRGSLPFPSLPFSTRKPPFQDDAVGHYGTLKEELPGAGSDPALYPPAGGVDHDRREDLYQWMAKQEPMKVEPRRQPAATPAPAPRGRGPLPCSLYPLQGPLALLDAHLVFRPVLRALGVSPHQVARDESSTEAGAAASPALESLGSKLCLLAWADAVRVDIVVSDLAKHDRRKTKKGSPHADAPTETAAFLCEKVGIDVDAARVADVSVDELVRRRNVLYISRAQLKRHISTVVNFNVTVRFISQQVNMPLLRLQHQISSMYDTIRAHAAARRHALAKLDDADVSDFQEPAPPTPPPPPPPAAPASPASPPLKVAPRRPQSFAQKLRSTGKTVKGKLGYSSLNEGAHTPMFSPAGPPPAPPPPPPPPRDADGKLTPRCWKTVYLLLDLYANMPDADTITHRFSVSTEIPEQVRRAPSAPTAGGAAAGGAGGAAAGPAVVVVGRARIHRTRLLASLSGLKLEGEVTSLQASLSTARRQCSLAGNVARSCIVLLEGSAPHQQTVVRVCVGKSHALYGSDAAASAPPGGPPPPPAGPPGAGVVLSVGPVRVDLPQHPVALHGVMTRSSRQLSSTLQELGVTRTSSRQARSPGAGGGGGAAGAAGAGSPAGGAPAAGPGDKPRPPRPPPPTLRDLHLSVMLQSITVTAALLPSLQAQYKMERVHGAGAACPPRFTVDLPTHSLSFTTRLQMAEANIPAAASVSLPAVHVAGRAVDDDDEEAGAGRHLAATAHIGVFEHTLSTDLLNHLVFVQKVFMKEVNEVVQKVYGAEKPVPLWADGEPDSPLKKILFSLTVRIKCIQLTATTPSSSAVRLETGAVQLCVSNRVSPLMFHAQVDLNLSLGQLIRNSIFEEAEPDLQQYAFFNTRISMRNASGEEVPADAAGAAGAAEDKEVVLIHLQRPLIYIQPVAVDKAVLVWLNYKNAYEYWNEKRLSLNTEVLAATQQVFEKVQLTSQMAAPHLSTLFLQLNVDDIGICLPLNQPPAAAWGGGARGGDEARGAVVVTLQSTRVSCVSSHALVSAGSFTGLSLRLAHDFETSLDDWQPPRQARNVCRVAAGTYQVCSRTTAAKHQENAKWFLNVSWQMEGVDVHLDVSVGQQLSALGHTLTMLTGFEDEDAPRTDCASDPEDEAEGSRGSQESVQLRRKCTDHLPAWALDPAMDARRRSRLIEREVTEQAKVVGDLRALGASHRTVELEMRRLHDLEALLFKDFRRDMLQKLRRQSVRASTITKGKLGLGSNRSRSFHSGHREDTVGSESGSTLLPDDERLADIIEAGSWSSVESEPPGPARSASLRAPRAPAAPPAVQRQSSLPQPAPEPEPCPPLPPLPSPGEAAAAAREPSVDFELDVQVHINSGRTALHTKDPPRDDHIKMGRSARGHRAEGSPPRRKRAPPERTVFQVPALQLKVHYESKTLPDVTAATAATPAPTAPAAAPRKGVKRAALFAWITVQSIPEETVISPHILEFLEQTLEPLPAKPPDHSPPDVSSERSLSSASLARYDSGSFPVDVVVRVRLAGSAVRFSCEPHSRVACLLRLPTLHIVASSQPHESAEPATVSGGLSVTGCLADFSVYMFHPYGGRKPAGAPLSDAERKDSLSVNVEFVKFHLCRARKVDLARAASKATLSFNTIVDIGSASFKYDMRRLSEILSFPRAWYRRSIVRRMFLGDLGGGRAQPADGPAPASPLLPPRDKTTRPKENGAGPSQGAEPAAPDDAAEWETLVLFAVNFTKLNVHMNMGNVMGNVSWQSGEFQCRGRLSIGSVGRRDVLCALSLGHSALDARAGIVAGAFSLQKLDTAVVVGGASRCGLRVRAAAAELRLEYMGTQVLLARLSRLHCALRDAPTSQRHRPALVLAHGKLSWQQLQLLMSRSTTPDLIKIQLKLEEFFSQQFQSSRRVLSSLHPTYQAHVKKKEEAGAGRGAAREQHRHWRRVLRRLGVLRANSDQDTVAGGTMELYGSNVSLACFHGTSFKAKSWALFSLKEPSVSFATEAQEVVDEEGARQTHVVQSLSAQLGAAGAGAAGSMATVCRVSRALLFPPQYKTIKDWFAYAFAHSDIDAIELFPSLEREAEGAGGAGAARGGGGGGGGGRAPGAERHAREVIFALPPLQLLLRTHQRPHKPLGVTGVECSFITEFEDHIFVSVDAEAFLFLHDLISSYIKEKDRVLSAGRTSWGEAGTVPPPAPAAPAPAPAPAPGGDAPRDKERLSDDVRDYSCVTWHLEPTVRLLSWGGKSIEPYGVDYILQKLGFSHARTTIPKWLQRGALDPLDQALALILLRIVEAVPPSRPAPP